MLREIVAFVSDVPSSGNHFLFTVLIFSVTYFKLLDGNQRAEAAVYVLLFIFIRLRNALGECSACPVYSFSPFLLYHICFVAFLHMMVNKLLLKFSTVCCYTYGRRPWLHFGNTT